MMFSEKQRRPFMFYCADNPLIRYTGRWAPFKEGMATTAPGAFLELSFTGRLATLHFDVETLTLPFPHLWLELDGGALIEVPVDRYLKISAKEDGPHRLRIVYKSARETASRWKHPLQGYVLFLGFDANEALALPKDPRKRIEFVGDSITEGVLIDPHYAPNRENDQYNRPYQDDALGTYGALLAKKLDLVPINVGYGAVGVTKGGCGGVPSAPALYDFCFEDAPYNAPPADFVLINHGTNDRHQSPELFTECYKELLDLVFLRNEKAKVIVLVPFCGAFQKELKALVPAYCKEKGKEILLIDTEGWLPPEPLHPLREGHALAAEKIEAIFREHFSF
jgi:hypothetical protein